MSLAVSTENLTKDFETMRAVNNVNLKIARGLFYGFLGPNGAGKSTTIKMLTGLMSPTAGRIEILGIDFSQNPVEVKKQIGVVPENLALFDRLTAAEYLNFVGRMYGLSHDQVAKRATELLELMELTANSRKLIIDFSHGMKKKIALSAALIHSPKVLFLDEPFEGVDAIAAKTMKDMLNAMISHGATIFLTSHVLDIVEKLCTDISIINCGTIVAQGSIEQLREGVFANSEALTKDLSNKKLTLEEIFIEIVGGGRERSENQLSWLVE
ncbi:MAG: ABC transporter ATP-binding protein [Blastocatellia bacterium]|nr:ABC transporter ATP-binding protein [Blastocatellia bacterium]MBL8193704.1 ABC transporter ATP-binding protein [Blastocatellia bacterium]MBN8722719.1 ABC transporter ATP-binding protein [Acidobacteriota bacterium]